jgi:hypothetical protein
MVRHQAKNWGLRATLCAGVVIWEIYQMATTSVMTPGQGGYTGALILGAALVGLVASLLKMSTES